jgi:hypothetical protein
MGSSSIQAQSLNKLKLSPTIGALGAFFLLGVLEFKNGLYLFICLAALYVMVALLFRNNRPGMIVFAFALQWVQVITYVIWMNSFNRDINFYSHHADVAIICACIGLVVIALVFNLTVNKIPLPDHKEFAKEAKAFDEKKLLIVYSTATLFLGGLQYALGENSGFAQILGTLASLKWIFFMIYGYTCWANKKNWPIFAIMVLFEFTTSLYSYFSNFKEVILMAIAMGISLVRTISFKQVVLGLLAGAVLVFIFIGWTAIKSDYRNYLNQGKGQQVVEVSRSEALSKIGEKVSTLTWDDLQFASYMLMYRLQYILHLGKSMDRVPDVLPYEDGNLWWENITYVLEPRLLFPNKPIYDATIKTVKYTGIRYSGRKAGSSFSLGYFADSYIDFGFTGMFFPLAIIGLVLGGIYRLFMRMKNISVLFRYTIVNVVFYEFSVFEADGLYLFGRLVLLTLVYFILAKTVFPRLQSWLYKEGS